MSNGRGSNRKKTTDPRGGHVRLYHTMIDSMAWRCLSWLDQGLYIALRRKLNGSNNGNIEATLATLRHAGITSSASLSKSLRALKALGFIAQTRQGTLSQGRKECSLYRFTDEETLANSRLGVKASAATNDWTAFKTLAEARAALKAAHGAAKRPGSRTNENKVPVRKVNRTDSNFELIRPQISSEAEHGDVLTARNLKPVKEGETIPKARMQPGFSTSRVESIGSTPPASNFEHLYRLPPMHAGGDAVPAMRPLLSLLSAAEELRRRNSVAEPTPEPIVGAAVTVDDTATTKKPRRAANDAKEAQA